MVSKYIFLLKPGHPQLIQIKLSEVMRFTNDHERLPLLNQMQKHYEERVKIIDQQRELGAIVINFVIVAQISSGAIKNARYNKFSGRFGLQRDYI